MFGLGFGGGSARSRSPSSRSSNSDESNGSEYRTFGVEFYGTPQKYLTNCRSFYSCIYCRTHLANHDDLVSRSFQGNRSRAYLFNSVINITSGALVQRTLNTGTHTVADIFCVYCGIAMGWKYVKAFVESQKYKEGKYIIELAHVVRENRHLELDKRDMLVNNQASALNSPTSSHRDVNTSSTKRCSVPTPDSGSSSLDDSSRSRWSSLSPSSNQCFENKMLTNDSNIDEDEDEDELMFPLCDDLLPANRSSCSSFSSSSMYAHKTRRSFYLESTPYDWKYSFSAEGPSGGQKTSNTVGSLNSSGSSPSSSGSSPASSSASSSAARPESGYGTSSLPIPLPSTSGSVVRVKREEPVQPRLSSDDDEHERLLKQSLMLQAISQSIKSAKTDQSQQQHNNSSNNNSNNNNGQTQFTFDAEIGCTKDKCDSSMGQQQHMGTPCDQTASEHCPKDVSPRLSAKNPSDAAKSDNITTEQQTDSLRMDDDEFYDCCTEHNLLISNQ